MPQNSSHSPLFLVDGRAGIAGNRSGLATRRAALTHSSALTRSAALLDRRSVLVSALGAGAAGIVSTFSLPAFAKWNEIDDDDGIKVFKQELPDSSIFAFRGVTVIDAPLEKILWVVADNQHRTEWVDRLKQSIVLERKSDVDFVLYQHFGAPAVVSDRDFVFRAQAYSLADGSVKIEIKSVTHPKAPPTVGVRGDLKHSSYTLKRVGEQTQVDVTVHMDPRGSLPTWIVNMIQKSWPLKTLSALRTHVKKPFVGSLQLPPTR